MKFEKKVISPGGKCELLFEEKLVDNYDVESLKVYLRNVDLRIQENVLPRIRSGSISFLEYKFSFPEIFNSAERKDIFFLTDRIPSGGPVFFDYSDEEKEEFIEKAIGIFERKYREKFEYAIGKIRSMHEDREFKLETDFLVRGYWDTISGLE